MESQVSLVNRLILARQPHEAHKILINMFLIVRNEEEDRSENGFDLDEVGVGWLAVFDLKVFLSCFEESGKFFGQHGVQSGLSA